MLLNRPLKIILHSFVIWSLVICHYSFALAKEFDGIWFLGFNLDKGPTKELAVRQAINQAINKSAVNQLVSAESTPASIIPPTMLGYDPDLAPSVRDIKQARALMKKTGFPINDSRLKKMSLLHTDGVLTVKIAEQLKEDLSDLGIKLNLVQVSYEAADAWQSALSSSQYDFFLMGYKAGLEQLYSTSEAANIDSASLAAPLFSQGGEANFTNYESSQVDFLLQQLSGLDPALKAERHAKLKELNHLLYQDLPVIVLFYIEKL